MTPDVFPNRLHRFPLLTACCLVLLATPSQSQQPAPSSTPADASQPAPSGNFFARLVHFYHDDWFPAPQSGPTAPTPPRRGLPSPLDSPPFPNADWSYGGAPVIGEPDTNTYPLMTALHPNGSLPRTKAYGWLAPAVDGSTSSITNAPDTKDGS